jgi:hypothetical protein
MEGSDETCVFSAEGNEDTTMLVQIEEAKCAIRTMSFVTVLSPVRAVGDKGRGWQACEVLRGWALKGLFCDLCQWTMTLNSGHDVSE